MRQLANAPTRSRNGASSWFRGGSRTANQPALKPSTSKIALRTTSIQCDCRAVRNPRMMIIIEQQGGGRAQAGIDSGGVMIGLMTTRNQQHNRQRQEREGGKNK